MNLRKFTESLSMYERRELVKLLLVETPEHRILVRDWVEQTPELSERSRNAMKHSSLADSYMDEISTTDLMKIRNLGVRSMKEITQLYPYIKN